MEHFLTGDGQVNSGLLKREVADQLTVENSIDSKQSKYRFPKKWEQVMQAGFASFPVGKLQSPGMANVQVVFTSIPEEPATRLQFHNTLVNACEVSVRTWADALSKQEQKATEKKRKTSNMEPGQDDAKEADKDM